MIKIYTDGSCKGNGKENAVGAWGFVILDNDSIIIEHCDTEFYTTNNRMEMNAIIKAIKSLEEYSSYYNEINLPVEIYTDSAYVHNCIKQKWYEKWENNNWINSKKEPVKNKDLWEELIPYFKNKDFIFYKVKGHSKDENEHEKWNNYVDELVQSAAQKIKEVL